jgi:REP element-mobilizing transposase RayT
MKYNPDVHHRRSIRLKGFDYNQASAYFVTMVCRSREPVLESNADREIVQRVWNSLPNRFPSIELDEFVIMPNHVHGIIVITDARITNPVGAIHELPLLNDRKQRRLMALPKIIGYFKMNTGKQINRLHQQQGIPFWQRNYYEHIIRNETDLNRIRQYIRDNPLNWEIDEENPQKKAGAIHELSLQSLPPLFPK